MTLRRVLLADEPRALRVLGVATRAAGWGTPTTPGVGRGLAICTCYGSWVAQIAVVSAVSGSEEFRVERVTCAVDCGRVVNPDGVRAQIEGAIIFGLSAALRAESQIRKGRVVQSNFHNLQILGLAECPEIDVHLVASDAPPGGAGEVGTPPVAPAVANALHAATGRRVRRLPLARGDA